MYRGLCFLLLLLLFEVVFNMSLPRNYYDRSTEIQTDNSKSLDDITYRLMWLLNQPKYRPFVYDHQPDKRQFTINTLQNLANVSKIGKKKKRRR